METGRIAARASPRRESELNAGVVMPTSTNPLTIFLQMGWGSFTFDLMRYLIAAVSVALAVALLMRTSLKTRKIQARSATAADIRREMLQSIRSCVVYVGVTVSIVWAINMGLINKVGESLGWPTDLALLAAIIIAHDAYFYWIHRTLHHPLLYKRFHLAHHRSTTPTPFAAYSFSVGEAALMGLFVILWQLVVATPGWVMFSFLAFQIGRNAMGHAGFELMPRWWLSTRITSWINTTTHHDLHHAGGFNTNYGLYFTFWDKWMGTEHPRYAETFHRVTATQSAKAQTELAPSPVL
jgi:Delta7-sterol 5-desaturase